MKEFEEILLEECGLEPAKARDVAAEIAGLAARYRALCADDVNNCGLSEKQESEQESIKNKLVDIATEIGAGVKLTGDPRSPTVRLLFASGASNSMIGGWAVPDNGQDDDDDAAAPRP